MKAIGLLIILCSFFSLQAQTTPLTRAERERQTLLQHIWQSALQKEALNRQLRPLQIQIDSLQRRQAKSSKIAPLQKRALHHSQQIVMLQARLDSLYERLVAVNARLFRLYNQQIDSLRQRVTTARKAAQKNVLLTRIKQLLRKRLLVSPELKNLSLDVQNLGKLNPNEVQDSLKRAILIDYLQNALREIDRQVDFLQLKHKELRQMQRLQEKARAFVDEINDAQLSSALPFQQTQKRSIAPQGYGDREIDMVPESILPAASPAGVVVDLPQIDRLISQSLQAQSTVPIDSVLKTIERAQNTLESYRALIQSRLKQ